MIVYSHTNSARLQYVLNFLSAYYNQPVTVTTDEEAYIKAEGLKINYTPQPLSNDALWIEPSGLLFDKGVRAHQVSVFNHPGGYKAFYKARGHVGFDLFAAIFFLLTRYEEYGPHQKDAYGRYDHQQSTAYKNNFLHQPLINIWLEDFSKLSGRTTQNTKPTTHSFLPTYDIDIAWSYKNKEAWVSTGGVVRSLLKGEWAKVKERRTVRTGVAQDPYDSYGFMDSLHQQFHLQPLYFIHVGQMRNRYDKNISTNNPEFRQLVVSLSKKYSIGLHPSWASNEEAHLLAKEKGVLEEIIGGPITRSRQHFIKWSLPTTYRRLLALGITDDYSMGYGSINGFRASVAVPYYWYDIEKEEQTTLRLHPFAFMDANALFEQRQSPEQSLKELLAYYRSVTEVNGELVTIWHNTFLGTDKLFKGWREVYITFLQKITGVAAN